MAITLSFKTVRCPEGVGRERREVTRAPFAIGRGTESDWVLPDPDKILSKRHCNITAKGETWLITDISSNGTSLNGSTLDPDLPHPLRDHDRLTLGQYEFEVHLDESFNDDASEAQTRFGNWSEKVNQSRLTSDPFPPHEKNAADSPNPPIGLQQDFDALGDSDEVAENPYAARDDTPDLGSHFKPPRPSSAVLPDDWDAEEELSASGPERPADADRTPEPTASTPSGHSEPKPRDATPRRDVEPPANAACSRRIELPEDVEPLKDVDPPPVAAKPPVSARTRRARPVPADPERSAFAADEEGFAAFASGAGYNGPVPRDTRKALRGLGAAFRAMVSGLRQSIIARATVKTEFRIDRTMIRAAGNNPIKFAADDDDALAALIGAHRRSDASAQEAVTEAMRDIALHELAVAAAMQSAVRELLAELAPDKIARGVRRTKLDQLIGSLKQASWDAYVESHAEVTRALADDFDSVFGRSFARAYEAALEEVSASNDGGRS